MINGRHHKHYQGLVSYPVFYGTPRRLNFEVHFTEKYVRDIYYLLSTPYGLFPMSSKLDKNGGVVLSTIGRQRVRSNYDSNTVVR